MAGGGVYSLTTRGAEDVINKSIPLAVSAINSISISEEQENFTFSDMGTADGGTSIKLVEKPRETKLNFILPKKPFLYLYFV